MRILVTGSAGFVGGEVVTQLTARGHDVVGIDALIPQAHGPGSVLPPGTRHLDVRAAAEWADQLDGVDVVCHQAAMVGAGVTVADLPLYAGHNDLGTGALLAAMSARGVDRLVLASSMVVYGEGRYTCAEHRERRPGPREVGDLEVGRYETACDVCGAALAWATVPEDAPMDPRSSYAVSKLAQEHYARVWTRQASAAAVALRYHNVYGPGMPRDTPYSGVAAIFRSALERGEAPRVFEDGGQMRDFVHVSDVARANVLAVESVGRGIDARAGYVAYNVCSGQPVSIGEVARILAEGREPQVTGQYRIGDVRHVVASPALAAAELGFVAAVGPQEGLAGFRTAELRR